MIIQSHLIDFPICLCLQEFGGDDQAALHSKIQLLETKLAEALEKNKLYRAQQKWYAFHCKLKCVIFNVQYTSINGL